MIKLFTPSQLVEYSESPYASWASRFNQESEHRQIPRNPEDPLQKVLVDLGLKHEKRKLEEWSKLTIVTVTGDSIFERYTNTMNAMKSGADIIYQGCLTSDHFYGYSDFLKKVEGTSSRVGDWSYEVIDTKLANTVKPTFVLQLMAYNEMLEDMQGVMPKKTTVILGNSKEESMTVSEYMDYYQLQKSRFLVFHDNFTLDEPNPEQFTNFGDFSDYAENILIQRDDLSKIATITRSQIKRIREAGINRMADLAETDLDRIPNFSVEIFQRLKKQAHAQLDTERRRAHSEDAKPYFEIIENKGKGLDQLPPPSPLDVFFDIEGNPMADGGLEYLWGNTILDEAGGKQFVDFWAHDADEEKQAFIDFITWAYNRWVSDPTMHIYHYASYEITACQRLMSRHGVMEFELDELLRHQVFVDLYKVVKGGLLLGEKNYSIKSVEHLYRGKRDTAVANGGESIIEYENWKKAYLAGVEGYTWETSKLLNDIRDYNIDDCDSTLELTLWLRERQAEANIQYSPNETRLPESDERVETDGERLRKVLHEGIHPDTKDPGEQLKLTLGWLLEFHRREDKPVYWRLFDRLSQIDTELFDDNACLAMCRRTDTPPQKATPRDRNPCYEYEYDVTQDFKGGSRFHVAGVEKADGKTHKVDAISQLSDLENGIIALKSNMELPDMVTLVPDEIVGAKKIIEGITRNVEAYLVGLWDSRLTAIRDFLNRTLPRFKSGAIDHNGNIIDDSRAEDRMTQILSAVNHLDNSYLPIQGPPGCGKTYTGKHIIADLLKQGCRIGVSSNSHKAINNLVLSAAQYCQEEGIAGEFYCSKDTDDRMEALGVSLIDNDQIKNKVDQPCVIGTTAWGFARDDIEGAFDYLIIDEAGQVSIANLLGMAAAAHNIIIMGDQQQLGQPIQVDHPGESGASILDYLLRDSATVDNARGIFLDTTYRMHSNVNRWISDAIYEGKLKSHSSNDERRIDVSALDDPRLKDGSGIVNIAIDHVGNSQNSEEEAYAIKALVEQLEGCPYFDGKETRPIARTDMLFVSPYNFQVATLKKIVGSDIHVGSVDKFQGQEAPIIFVSMCSSDASDSPRGADFLLNKNRINVAISRAQCLAIVVSSQSLLNGKPNSLKVIKNYSLFSNLLKQ